MKTKEFLQLNSDQQFKWIEKNIPDYEMLLYDDSSLGCSYPLESINFSEYENYPLDYDTSGIIQIELGNLSKQRVEEIDEGTKLTKEEKYAVAKSIAETDYEGLLGHHVIQITLADGNLFAYFHGHSAGQGGFTWEFVSAHLAKSEVVSQIKKLPFFTAI
tara:strand:- start:7 stop:486 length:480 start_codon:yes stop_codon:yes gene_type:complete